MNTNQEKLLAQLNWRYATKQYDPARKISDADWAVLEEALLLTPSSGGLTPWKVINVTDKALREKLVPVSYGQRQVADASNLLIFAVPTEYTEKDVDEFLNRVAEVRHISVESLAAYRGMMVGGIIQAKDPAARQVWASRQAYIALGNLLTSAAMIGIDATPMEGFMPDKYNALLGLDKLGLTAVVICPLGYRSTEDKYATLPKVRFPKAKVLLTI